MLQIFAMWESYLSNLVIHIISILTFASRGFREVNKSYRDVLESSVTLQTPYVGARAHALVS